MASPAFDARLRIINYIPHTDGSSGSAKEIIFPLKVERLQKDITDGSMVISLPDFNNEPLSFGIIRYTMSVEGMVLEDGRHVAHPTTDAVEHTPDFIDLEEAVLLWQKEATIRDIRTLADEVPQLEVHFNGIHGVTEFTRYKFLFMRAEIAKIGGQVEIPFKFQLGVLWDLSFPGVREWST